MLDMVNVLTNYKCGELDFGIPGAVFNLVHYVVLIIQIVVPILLIIWGMLDFAKGLTKGKDEDIKAGQKTFISRLIVAVVVFLVVTVVNLMVGIVANVNADSGNGEPKQSTMTKCISCFVKGTKDNPDCVAG